ncbi:MAG TPA: hypothetical protein VD794_11945, partial [Flavisolibacter sp.]|nr:hypothetical protein [Flavisolibacter sp.]
DNNAGWAERSLTSRCALPLMTSFRDNFNRKLHTDWGYGGQNIYVDYDQSVYSELEIDRKQATDWIKQSDWLTIRQKYALQNLEIPQVVQDKYGEMLDEIYIPNGYVKLDELNIDFNEE